jgi:hypothetical protein
MVIAATAATMGGIKAAIDIAKGVQSLHVTTEVKQAVSDILDQLLVAREAALTTSEEKTALLERIRSLEQEILSFEKWDSEKERYELKRYYPGTLAYSLKPEMAGTEPSHHLCTQCYQRGEKSILQPNGEVVRRYKVHRCNSCKLAVPIGPEMLGDGTPEPEPPTPRIDHGGSSWVSSRRGS